MTEDESKSGLGAILWLASKDNRDEETRNMAKEILDTICYIQHAQDGKEAKR